MACTCFGVDPYEVQGRNGGLLELKVVIVSKRFVDLPRLVANGFTRLLLRAAVAYRINPLLFAILTLFAHIHPYVAALPLAICFTFRPMNHTFLRVGHVKCRSFRYSLAMYPRYSLLNPESCKKHSSFLTQPGSCSDSYLVDMPDMED